MPSDTDDENAGATVDSKVARLLEVYGLGDEYGDRLEELWTADGEKRESLRSLADRFNERLLESAMDDAGTSAVEGEVGNLYRLLTADDVSSGNRIEARQRLEQNGVDIEQLERDFVTYQAIRTYLKEYRGATYEQKSSGDRVETVVQTIQRLRSRTQSVAERSLDQLRNTDQLSLGEFRIFVDISVLCEDCDTQYGVVELLQEGGCDCDAD
jgi:hypothetical protein